MKDDVKLWQARRAGKTKPRHRDHRDPYERDRARVIHSAAFRRLQAKTQVLGIAEGDFHRTRLTHSMEVAQVAGGIAGALRRTPAVLKALHPHAPEQSLAEAIGLAHDLGHPPFGHGGEVALNFMMRDHGGFEGNAHTLRLVAKREPFTESCGLDLTRRVLLGILKYPVSFAQLRRPKTVSAPAHLEEVKAGDWKPPKCYFEEEQEVVEWLLTPFDEDDRERFQRFRSPTESKAGTALYKGFDTSLMEIADDISYGVHDVEDGIALELIRREHWVDVRKAFDERWSARVGCGSFKELSIELFADSWRRKKAIGALVNGFVVSATLKRVRGFTHPLLRYNVTLPGPAQELLDAMKALAWNKMIAVPAVQTLEYRGQLVVMSLYRALCSDPHRLMPPKSGGRAADAPDENEMARSICDYVAGMTDGYAERMYERLFVPGKGSVFGKL